MSPDTVPVYVTAVEPTVPNVMVLPFTVPVRGALPDVDRLIVPASLPDVSTQVSWKVPVKAPLYVPVHLPLRDPTPAVADVAGAGVDAAGVVAAAVVAGGGDELAVPEGLLLHPVTSIAGSATAAAAAARSRRSGVPVTMGLPFRLGIHGR